jgi:DNA-binding CsgD family transcriptional regulator
MLSGVLLAPGEGPGSSRWERWPRARAGARLAVTPGELLERSAESEALEAAVTAAADGHGTCILVEGSAGIGKTSLLGVAEATAEERGLEVLAACGSALEGEYPFGLARSLFEPALAASGHVRRLAAADGLIGTVFPALTEVFSRDREPVSRDSAARVVVGLHRLTLAIAASRPVALVADDVHWSDEQSLRYLVYLARRIAALPVVMVLAARSEGEWFTPALRLALLRDGNARHLLPRGLSAPAVVDLLASDAGGAVELPFAEACRRRTGGNPFYLVDLKREIGEIGLEPVASNAPLLPSLRPGGVGLSVEERLHRLAADAAALARAVAVIGDGFPLAWASELAGLAPPAAGAASDALRSVTILAPSEDLAFAHPIIATAVYQSIAPAERAVMHGDCAQIAHRRHAPAGAVAAHLLRALPGGGPWRVETLLAAASYALEQGAPTSAVTYLRRALDEELDQAARSRVLVELGTAEALARLPEAVTHLVEVVTVARDPDDRVLAALALWSTSSFDGRVSEGLAMLREVLASGAGAQPDHLERLELELARATRSWRPTAAEGRQRIAAFVAREQGMGPTLRRVAVGLSAYDAMLANEPVARVLELVEQALPLDDTVLGRSESQLLHLPIYTLIYCDALDRLASVLAQFEAATTRRGAAMGTVIADLWRTLAALRAGKLAEAEASGARALAGAVEQEWLFGQAGSRLLLAEIAVELGDVRAALGLDGVIWGLVSADSDLDDKGWADHMLHGSAICSMAAGDPATALSILLEVGRRHDAWQARCPSELPWRSNAALCALMLGDRRRAEALAREEVELAEAFGARRALGIAQRVHGLAVGSEASLREAVTTLTGSPARLEHARALCDLGVELSSQRRYQDARAVLHDALASAEELGASALARRARSELRAAGGRPRPHAAGKASQVTSAELRTAHLAARGMSNPQIAGALYVSRKTVETQLYNVYRKLGIASRGELAEALADVTPAGGATVADQSGGEA